MAESHLIPLFPVGTVLLPGTALPLHIFEERYRTMIAECYLSHRDFGIVYYNGGELQKSGCGAHVLGTVHRYNDGRVDILTSGTRRFEIQKIDESGAYLQAKVRFFEDTDEDSLALSYMAGELIRSLEKLADIAGRRFDSGGMRRLDPRTLSFVLSNTDLASLPERQTALEMRSTHRRLEKLISAASRALYRARSTRKVQDLVGITGDITHLFN